MAEVQLGQFAVFIALPIASLFFLPKMKSLGITGFLIFVSIGVFAFVMLGAAALYMAAQYDVVITKHIPESETTASASTIQVNSNGTMISNTTKTATVINPAYDETVPIIDSYQTMWAYVLTGLLFMYGIIWVKVLMTGSP